MRLVMMGTGAFAVPTFRRLLESPRKVAALVTRPRHPVHGRKKGPINPMRQTAEERGVPLLLPEDVNAQAARAELAALAADLFVVCDYGQILSAETLGLARLGGINLHGSLLPKYRGAAPVQWAVYHGERETGVTVIHMTPRLDAGPCLVQESTPVGPHETAAELEARLAVMGAGAVERAISLLANGGDEQQGMLQDSGKATRAPRLKKADGQVDWSRAAAQIRDQVRAFKPWPGTYTYLPQPGGEPLRLLLDDVAVVADEFADAARREDFPDEARAALGAFLSAPPVPGTVLLADHGRLWAACGRGVLALLQVQPAGKRVMTAGEFLNGHALRPGDVLGA